MPVGYRTVRPEQRGAQGVDFGDRGFVLRCLGFNRNRDGALVIKDQPARSGEGTVRKLYWNVEIQWPEELRDLSPGFSTPLKGIQLSRSSPELSAPDLVDFTIAGEWTPWLLARAQDFGFQLNKLDPDDPLHDAVYIEAEMASLQEPLSIEQVLERVIEPKIVEAGRWVRAKCMPGTSWVDAKTVEPLTSDEQLEIERRIAELPSEKESPIPMDEEDLLRETLTQEARALAREGLMSAELVAGFATEKGWTLDQSQPLLNQLTAAQLEELLSKLRKPKGVQL